MHWPSELLHGPVWFCSCCKLAVMILVPRWSCAVDWTFKANHYLSSVVVFFPPVWCYVVNLSSFLPGSSDVTVYPSSGLVTPSVLCSSCCCFWTLTIASVLYVAYQLLPSVVSGRNVFCKTLHGCDFNEILLYETLRHCSWRHTCSDS